MHIFQGIFWNKMYNDGKKGVSLLKTFRWLRWTGIPGTVFKYCVLADENCCKLIKP